MATSGTGHFTRADCRRLWHEPEYADMDQEMLGLMEKFELCYRLTDTHEPTWLAPRLLPPSKPASLAGWAAPTDLVVRYRYATGKFTEEEFEVAHAAFKSTGKPLIYTFFNEAKIATSSMNLPDLQSLQALKDKLKELGHYHTHYNGVEHLKRQFMDQLQKLRDAGRFLDSGQ